MKETEQKETNDEIKKKERIITKQTKKQTTK